MKPLWRWQELRSALGLAAEQGPDISGFAIDSRRLSPGDLFVALLGDPGPRFYASSASERDGHDFVADAIRRGAAGVLVHRDERYGVPALCVPDTLDGLWALGRHRRSRLACPVAAVTGSSGKTTCKEFLAGALGAFATGGSFNNHIGVPLSLASTPVDATAAVYEIGTNHPGEIAPLSRLAAPNVAIVLNIHPAHIEFFDGLDGIRREKLSIAEGLGADGVLVRNEQVQPLDDAPRTLTFGKEASADVRLVAVDGDRARLATPEGIVAAPVPGGGRHRAMSVAACAAALLALGLPLAQLERLAAAKLPKGRGNRIEAGGVTVIDDSYNANPASMTTALLALAAESPGRGGRRIAVLGEMLELGDEGERFHRDLAGMCEGLEQVFCVGEGMKPLHEELAATGRAEWRAGADSPFATDCARSLRPGDTVLVKGSNRIFWASRVCGCAGRRSAVGLSSSAEARNLARRVLGGKAFCLP